ncbi:PREDICTED: UDP-glucose:glycoprotein glucosyltransferase [Ceratosolen solmsi marchali]|uniref:UDP-glucose:glycoprotein glucosyltransferase n=1 Tax=Ceratosolen solmsi marchali TaxID=326594 RepID=A0AAJ6YTB2_9HYME|nr:PREDICTED: UDP-glucose:glycoprotein glucosyltransferase [Ceratosolen solmsi marchali]
MLFFILFSPLLLNISPILAEKRINKYVTTLINAKWKDTPLILEAAEYLNDENPNYFWRFVDEVSNRSLEFEKHVTEKDHYDFVMSISEKFLTSAEIAVMKLGLSLRIYSPRIEMFYQMAENKKTSNINCNNFIDVGGKFVCSIDELQKFIDNNDVILIDTYSVDHFYLEKRYTNKTLVLYGQMGTHGFSVLHEKLKYLVTSNKINYILRHYSKNRLNKNLRLSGYGVELQMKSTEYKATDDSDIKHNQEKNEDLGEGVDEIDGINFSLLKTLYPKEKKKLNDLYTYLIENNHEIGALKVWQFQELSHQAAERIMSSPAGEAINVLTDISQNFPMQAKSLIKEKINNNMKKEMKLNQEIFSVNLNIQPTETALFINGLFFDLEAIDILTLLECLRYELRVMESLHKIGLDSENINKLLTLDISNTGDSKDFLIDIRDSAILWINDIENDFRYKSWSSSLSDLLRPTFPGMLRNIRRNFYNLVIIIDPLKKESAPLISSAESLYAYSAPLRIGFVFFTNFNVNETGNTDPSVAINNAYHYLIESKNSKDAMSFLSSLYNNIGPNGLQINDVKKAIKIIDPMADINYILGEESEYDVGRYLANDFIKRTGLKKLPQVLLNGIPLSTNQLNADSFEETVLSTIIMQTPMIQKAVYRGEIIESDDVVDFLMNQPHVMPRLNERVLKTEKNIWLNLIGSIPKNNDYTKWSSQDISSWLMKHLCYLYIPRKSVSSHVYTLWIVADLELELGRKLLKEALIYLESNAEARLSLIIYSQNNNLSEFNINKITLAAINTLSLEKSYTYIRNLMKEETYNSIKNGEFSIEEKAIKEYLKNEFFLLNIQQHYAKHILNLSNNERAVIMNGRIIGPFDEEEEFTSDDFALLERFSQSTYGDKLFKYLRKCQVNNDEYENGDISDIIMKITSLLVSKPQTRSRFNVPFHSDKFSVIKIPASNRNLVTFNLIAIVDPVSRGAQKLGPILNVLHQSLNCDIKVFLNCVDKNSDMPLKSFYRFVLEPELQFTSNGEIVGAIAKFTKLPSSSLLTQNIHAPENWLVEVIKSVYDLDNIKLDNVAIGVHSEFELEYLLLEGHCFETSIGNPPRGLQITLGTEKEPLMVDTIVMANLGYFQLKANPGEWLLKLRLGRSADIYDIVNVDGLEVIHNESKVKVLISSLKSNVLKLKVTKKSEKVDIDLLAEDDKESGIWNSISRTFTNAEKSNEQNEKLNIFSLASGHLYERFIKIMMLSVLKHTKTVIKFWFLKNYLSPTLKDFLPHMAKEYGFEYELIQYKWPRWLHQQTEKQRTIWGYKILFLDVLFPLDVKKIIFVDADQVVRADLKELIAMDLGGAPYAYTPFCDSRKEMDGFRFWKQGYWRNHLQGRSYHISALYVVDLKRFRRIAAGDRLRGQYQALSQDPNSLSNLDQDLPNNMIHQVAIKTLPQDWLWCETWCDDNSKQYAKTIDLCNNPMTKEAKLQAAMRILPEWITYDEEIKSLQLKIMRIIDNENKQTEKEEGFINEESAKHEEL